MAPRCGSPVPTTPSREVLGLQRHAALAGEGVSPRPEPDWKSVVLKVFDPMLDGEGSRHGAADLNHRHAKPAEIRRGHQEGHSALTECDLKCLWCSGRRGAFAEHPEFREGSTHLEGNVIPSVAFTHALRRPQICPIRSNILGRRVWRSGRHTPKISQRVSDSRHWSPSGASRQSREPYFRAAGREPRRAGRALVGAIASEGCAWRRACWNCQVSVDDANAGLAALRWVGRLDQQAFGSRSRRELWINLQQQRDDAADDRARPGRAAHAVRSPSRRQARAGRRLAPSRPPTIRNSSTASGFRPCSPRQPR